MFASNYLQVFIEEATYIYIYTLLPLPLKLSDLCRRKDGTLTIFNIFRTIESYLKDFQKMYKTNPNFLKETNPFMYTLLSNKNLSQDDCNMLAIEVFLGKSVTPVP